MALQAQTVAKEALRLKFDTTSSERDALQAESESLRGRLEELVGVQQALAELQVQHEAAAARLVELEEQHEVRQQGQCIWDHILDEYWSQLLSVWDADRQGAM
jgi:hypothetical protein